jgi:hypothetical protein
MAMDLCEEKLENVKSLFFLCKVYMEYPQETNLCLEEKKQGEETTTQL